MVCQTNGKKKKLRTKGLVSWYGNVMKEAVAI